MTAFAARLAVVFTLSTAAGAAARPDADPVYDGKTAAAWADTLQNDPSPRKRALAAAALGGVWADYRHPPALVHLGRALRGDISPAVRAQCATAIAALKPADARAVENDLVSALKDEKDARVRKELAAALGRFPDVAKKAVVPLAGVLKDADPAARVAAADALAKAGADAKPAAADLTPLLDDADKAVRQAAAFALGRISPDNPSFVAAALVKRFGAEKEADVRREALVSLKLLGDQSGPVVAAFAAALTDPDGETQAVAVRALGTFGADAKPAAEALFDLAAAGRDKDLRVAAARAFGSALGPALKGRVKDMIRLMEADPDFEVRVALVEEIAALGNDIKDDKDAMAALRKRLSDPQVKVREAAAAAIRRVEKKPEKGQDKPPAPKP